MKGTQIESALVKDKFFTINVTHEKHTGTSYFETIIVGPKMTVTRACKMAAKDYYNSLTNQRLSRITSLAKNNPMATVEFPVPALINLHTVALSNSDSSRICI